MNNKPLVSFLLFAYKQESFIKEAIESALSQTYEPLEIIISDDCSPDNTYTIIKETIKKYDGPHTVKINKNEKNLGLASHINHVFTLAKGDFIVMAAGDDISLPERTKAMVARWMDQRDPVDLVCSYFEDIDINSQPTGHIEKNEVYTPNILSPVNKWKCGATGACAGYSRLLFEKYGPIDSRIIAEDWIFSFRAWLENGIGVIELPLVRHRSHEECLSVINYNFNNEKDTNKRILLRKKATAAKLAQANEWLHSWKLSGRSNKFFIITRLRRLIKLIKLENLSYEKNRFFALTSSFKSLLYIDCGGIKQAARIFIRQVLRIR